MVATGLRLPVLGSPQSVRLRLRLLGQKSKTGRKPVTTGLLKGRVGGGGQLIYLLCTVQIIALH